MPRRPRRELPDGIFHVTIRGVDGCRIVRDDVDCRMLRGLLRDEAWRRGWWCPAYCIMGTHYHALVESRRADLSAGFHRVNGIYAQRFNKRHGRTGHLFGDRFASPPIQTEEHFLNAWEYILQNPVKADLCVRAAEWPWSGSIPRRATAAATGVASEA